jgi:biopolymer transport protein TolR
MAMTTGNAEINVTPLIDVLLVLIIIFMVVLPQHPVGLPAVAPQPASADAAPAESEIVVSVNRDRSILINQEPVEISKLPERLLAIFARRAGSVIFVRGHNDLEFKDIAQIIDLARGAGIVQVGLMTAY